MVLEVAKASSVPVMLVNQGEPAGRVISFLSTSDMAGDAVILDPTQSVASAAGSRAYPTTLFVGGDWRIVRVHSGEISRATLTAAIRDLEAKAK